MLDTLNRADTRHASRWPWPEFQFSRPTHKWRRWGTAPTMRHQGKPCHLLGYQTGICSPQETPHRTTATIKTAWSDCYSFPGQHQCSWPQEDAAHPLIRSSTTKGRNRVSLEDTRQLDESKPFCPFAQNLCSWLWRSFPSYHVSNFEKNHRYGLFFQLLSRGSKYQAELQMQAFFWGRNCCRLFFVLYFLHYTGPISTLFHSHSFFHLVSVLLLW